MGEGACCWYTHRLIRLRAYLVGGGWVYCRGIYKRDRIQKGLYQYFGQMVLCVVGLL